MQKKRPEGAEDSPIWNLGDRIENVDVYDFITSMNDKDLREFVIEILLVMGETAGVLMQEIEEIKKEIKERDEAEGKGLTRSV